jgi:hypothetical protein
MVKTVLGEVVPATAMCSVASRAPDDMLPVGPDDPTCR